MLTSFMARKVFEVIEITDGMGLFDGDPTCRFCRKETEAVYHIICCYEVLACQRCNVFGNLFIEPKDISTASVRDLCLFKKDTGLLNLS
jgi:hypothetical protein